MGGRHCERRRKTESGFEYQAGDSTGIMYRGDIELKIIISSLCWALRPKTK